MSSMTETTQLVMRLGNGDASVSEKLSSTSPNANEVETRRAAGGSRSGSWPLLPGLVLAAILALTITDSSFAQEALNFEFNVDGVLPSTSPDVNHLNNAGVSEGSVYSVSGGLLKQRTISVNGNMSYVAGTDAFGIAPGTFSFAPALETVIEARLKVLTIQGGAGVFFQAYDGVHRYSAFFTSSGFNLATAGGGVAIPVNVFDFHTYRLESPANSSQVSAYVDGVLVFTGTAATISAGFSGFGWGDGHSPVGNGGDADWDYIRARNGCAAPLALGILTLVASGDDEGTNGDADEGLFVVDRNGDAFFTSSGFNLATAGGGVAIPVNVFDFHTYRLEFKNIDRNRSRYIQFRSGSGDSHRGPAEGLDHTGRCWRLFPGLRRCPPL